MGSSIALQLHTMKIAAAAGEKLADIETDGFTARQFDTALAFLGCAMKEGGSQEGTGDAVDDRAHAHVVRIHVKPVHDWRPSDLPWEVGPHERKQHGHNIQHNALQHQWILENLCMGWAVLA